MIIARNINDIKPNPENPRVIRDTNYKKLVKSIKDFPEMLNIRPIVVNSDMMVLGGNMRLKACIDAGMKTVPVYIADTLDEAKQREFIIKDNSSFGEWNWDILANEWDPIELENWGLVLPAGLGNVQDSAEIQQVDDTAFMAVVIVAYKDIEDLDRITAFYELTNRDMTEEVLSMVQRQKKMYVFKK